MAGSVENFLDSLPDWKTYGENYEQQIGEVLALKSFFENTEYLAILAEISSESKYLIDLNIQVETKRIPIQVELWLPIGKSKESDTILDNSIGNEQTLSASKKISQFQRSISGNRVHTTINCNYLPFITLNVMLPDSYPSENKPYFKITCSWLSIEQLNRLTLKLNEIWDQNFNLPVLYTWFEWIQNNAIDYLDIHEDPNKIIITPLNENFNDEELNTNMNNTRCTFTDKEEFIYGFLRHNYIKELITFNNQIQICQICFDEKPGSEFFRLNVCNHFFCNDCMISMCQMHTKEGTVQLLKCPGKGCDEFVSVDIMSQVLNEEEFFRWERLLLQKTLDSMSDIIYCGKCSIPIVIDENDTHAYCMNCNIDYCKLCKEIWHSGKCLTSEEKIEKKIKNLNINLEQLANMTDEQIRASFKNALQVINLREKTIKLTDETKAEAFMKRFKSCTKCKAPIEKYDGCNKVTCICGNIICYVCGKQITGYEHFSQTSCSLWSTISARVPIERPRHEAQVALERLVNLVPDQAKFLIKCPTCAQQCLKIQKNNHIKCWLCKTDFCFSCKKKIIGGFSNHYKNTNCKQHSD